MRGSGSKLSGPDLRVKSHVGFRFLSHVEAAGRRPQVLEGDVAKRMPLDVIHQRPEILL